MSNAAPDTTLGDPQQFQNGQADPGASAAQQQAAAPPQTIAVVTPTSANLQPQGQLFTADQVEAARREEKDKLYGRIKDQESTLAELLADKQAREAAAAEAQAAAVEQQRLAEEAEMSAKELIERKDAEWQAQFARIEQERAAERAVAQKEQEHLQLMAYIGQVKMSVQDDVMPELIGNIGLNCNSIEEVDASASTAVAQTASILQNVTQAGGGPQGFQPPRGSSVTAPPVGPADAQASTKTFTTQDIENMSMAEYAQHRTALLHGASQHVAQNGPYGG